MSDSIAFGGFAFRRRSDFIAGGATKRPRILSLNYTQGDTEGGGQNIVITGENFRNVQSVTFGAAGNASIVVNNAFQITATLPAMKFGNLPSFDGINDRLSVNVAVGTLLPVGSYFYWVLFRANTVVGTTAISSGYANDAIFVDTGGYIGPHLRLNGGTPYVQTYHWDATGVGNEHEITVGKWHCLCVRHDGVNIHSSLDGGAVTSSTAGSYDSGVGTLQIGQPYTGGNFSHVDIAEIGMIGSDQNDALFTTIVASLNADYNLNLGNVSPVAYNRASLACTLLLQESNYDASGGSGVWTGTASAGSSGGRDATEATNYPTDRTPGHEALVNLIVTNNIGESAPYTFEYWDPTVDGSTRVVWDSVHTAYTVVGNHWAPRYVKPKINPTYTGLAECINDADAPKLQAPTVVNGAPSFSGDGTKYGLRTKANALTWDEILGAADASTKPGTIMLVQNYLDTTSAGWAGATPYNNESFIGEHAGGTIGLGGEYDGATPVVSGHIWHPFFGYRTIKVEVPAHGNKMMVFSRFGANGSGNFGVGVNGDTSGSTYSETIHAGGAYNEGAGTAYTSLPVDFGYKYDGSTSNLNQTAQGIVYTAVVQDARASNATITKLYKWTQQRFGV